MKVFIVQNTVRENAKDNMSHVLDLLEKGVHKQYDFIVLPEMFMTPYELRYFKLNQQNSDSQLLKSLSNIAKKYKSYLVAGSIPEASNKKIYNTSYIFDRDGKLVNKYRKIHLFSVTYPDGTKFSESDVLSHGNQIVTFDTDLGKMGIMICFDIRFPYLAHKLQSLDTKVIFVPAAFNTYTGPLHWHTTFRSRAIDNQMFYVGASPARCSFGSYKPYGHSLVVDPYGKIIEELDESENILSVDINLDIIRQARESIPILENEVDIQNFEIKK